MAKKKATTTQKTIETLRHSDSRRTNIPTAEQQSVMETEEKCSIRVAYERRNRDLDPQLVWRGKDEQDAGPLVVNAPPLYIQEKVHPKVLIDDLMKSDQWLGASGQKNKSQATCHQPPLFGDFNGLPEDAHATEFNKLGRIQVLKARMNADMHMSADLKNTGKGNLFVIFGEPVVEVVSGQWLLTSRGRQVCSYEQCKKLSGLAGLAENNGVGGSDLQGFQDVAAGRAIWSDQSDASGGSVDSVEHSGRSCKKGDRRVPAVSKSRKRLAGGDRDTTHAGRKVAVPLKRDSKSASDGSRGYQPHDRWTEAITQIEKLSEPDFPLSLATKHLTQVTIHGVDVFQPSTGEVRSDGAEGIACWFIDTDYNEESFFVRQAYFLGANDPYKSLKTTLKAEIDKEAWDSLNSDTSRPFPQPKSGRIAVKVINHLGDEVMKVFRVKEVVE